MTKTQSKLIEELALRHSSAMVQLTYRRTGDTETAKDLVQETFLIASMKADILEQHEKPEAWLYLTLQFLTKRELGRAYHKAEIPISDENILSSAENIELPMRSYLPEKLSDSERELLLLHIDKGLSSPDIAELYGITPNACRKRLSRTVQKCRTMLAKEK